MLKKHITILALSLLGISIHAQRNYLMFDYSISQFKIFSGKQTVSGISERLNRCEGNYTGASYHFSIGRKNSASIGIGLSQINYEKEWLGIFPESNQFGIAAVNGKISYWSFPVSFTGIVAATRIRNRYRNCRPRNDRFRFGLNITYIPCFVGKNSFSASTQGGADLHNFLTGFQSNEQSFQHSITVGLSNQVYLINKSMLIGLEPYAGIGSGYFKESGTNINNVSFGLRIRIGLAAKLPRISIEREVDKGNAEEKKKLLEQKQKEIQEQLNKNPK